MRFLSAFMDWLLLGGFGRFIRRLLAWCFGVALVTEVASNGLTYMAYVYGFLTVAMIVAIFDSD